ncbi:MAG: GNAT family N-acetyltransferase [Pseudomonadota bacterium]
MIVCRPFAPEYARELARMLAEMAVSYGAVIEPGINTEDALTRHARACEFLLAFKDERLAGFATFATLFPVGGLLAFLYVQQVYVAASERRSGVARCLMAGIALEAKRRRLQRVEWATSTRNTAARALYDSLGAVGAPKVQYVLDGDALSSLAFDGGTALAISDGPAA